MPRASGSAGKTVYAGAMTPPPAPISTDLDPLSATYAILRPDTAAGPVVFASPHSGRRLPDGMGLIPGLSDLTLRSAEDVAVDRLIASGRGLGAPVISSLVSRIYVDLNRAPDEMDPLLVEGVEGEASAKVAAGFGVVPRKAGDGADLYGVRLSQEAAAARLAQAHTPYHAALGGLMEDAKARHGAALLIDWHSMPSRAAGAVGRTQRGLDIVLGDRHGSAARGAVSRRVRALFEAEGWRVGLNAPYAGGYATQTWGRPSEGFQAVQVEINRALYLDERTLEPSDDYDRFAKALGRVIAGLARLSPG